MHIDNGIERSTLSYATRLLFEIFTQCSDRVKGPHEARW